MAEYTWGQLSTSRRCRVVASVAGEIASNSQRLIDLCESPWRFDPVETITAELFPLCGALRWIGKCGPAVLAEKQHGAAGRPAWLWGVQSRVRRIPLGKVLILAAWNYPLFLPGVQTAQALAAGNTVLLKPAPGCETVTAAMVDLFYAAGVPAETLVQIDSDPEFAKSAIADGVDLVVLTGGAATGQSVMQQAAKTLTPTIMELSGCDSVVVHPSADLDRAAKAIAFGMRLSSGATCIAPRRILVDDVTADELRDLIVFYLRRSDDPYHDRKDVGSTAADDAALVQAMHVHPSAQTTAADAIDDAIGAGAIDVMGGYDSARLRGQGQMVPTLLDHVCTDFAITRTDLFAPVSSMIRLGSINDSVAIINDSPFRLSASVFASDTVADSVSEEIAEKLNVGSIAINDLIIPTADPRVPFGGRGRSGFGVTRGEEGLLSMTAPQVIGHHHGNVLPHLRPRQSNDAKTLQAALKASYCGRWKERLASIRRMAEKG